MKLEMQAGKLSGRKFIFILGKHPLTMSSGTGVGLIKSVISAEDVVKGSQAEANKAIRNMGIL